MVNAGQNWETQEVIKFLINDDVCYVQVRGQSAETIRDFVERQRCAPMDLYRQFDRAPISSFDDVDWAAVQQSCV